MKNINTKKVVAGVAALGLSALLAGSVVASNVGGDDFSLNIDKGSMFNNGVPNVSVVVGSMAQPVDVVWAGNIAAAIGKKAYVSTTVAGGDATFEDVTVEVATEGATTISGDGYLHEAQFGESSFDNKTGIRNRDYALLYDDELEYRDHDRETQTISRIREEIDVSIDKVYYESDSEVQEIIAKIPIGALVYTLDLRDGITYWDGGKNVITIGGNHRITIPFLGKEYSIREIKGTASSITEIELVSEDSTLIYNQGERFAVEGYEVEIGTITSGTSDNKVLLRLFDGTTVVRTESLDAGDKTDFDGKLDKELTIVDVQYASDQMGYIEVSTAEGSMTLKTTDEVFVDSQGREWEVDFIAESGKLKSIVVKNLDGWTDKELNDEFPALRIGDSAELPGYLGNVSFLGLSEEDRYHFKTSRSSALTPATTLVINWENDDADHEIFAYAERPINTGGSRTMAFTLDNRDYWLTYTDSAASGDRHVVIRDVDDTTIDDFADGVYVFVTDDNATVNSATNAGWFELSDLPDIDSFKLDIRGGKGAYLRFESDIQDGVFHHYYLGKFGDNFGLALSRELDEKGTVTTVWDDFDDHYDDLTVADGNFKNTNYKIGDTSGNNTWNFLGSFLDDGSNGVTTKFWYQGNAEDIDETDGGIAKFLIKDVHSADIYVLMDPSTNRLADVEEISSTGLASLTTNGSTTVAQNKKVRYFGTNGFRLNDDDSDDLREGITDSGAHLSKSSGQVTFDFPEARLDAKFFIGGETSTDTEMLGSEVTLSTLGEVLEANGINVKLVNYNVSGGAAGGDAMVPANWNVNTRRLVYLDNETISGAGPKIIVGGHLVNTLADGITNEYLTQSGQFVVGAMGDGNVIVAGWSATDTANAAKELITVIENM